MPKALTPEQERELIEEYEEGASINDLSVTYRVVKSTVYRTLRLYKVPLRVKSTYGRKSKPPRPRKLKPCGSNAAYHRHRRANELPCDSCTIAHNKYEIRNKKKRKKS